MKTTFLDRFVEASKLRVLNDLTENVLQEHLNKIIKKGRSARTANQCRSAVLAFLNWCVRSKRLIENPVSQVPKFNESLDRRRIRRSLTTEELVALLNVAATRDEVNRSRFKGNYKGRFAHRHALYLFLAHVGLRRNESRLLLWADCDLACGQITVRAEISKEKRTSVLPLHRQVVEELTRIRPHDAKPNDRVFLSMVTIKTFYQDLQRARQGWIDAADDSEERERRELSDFCKQIDSRGRWLDMHGFRMYLASRLAREGVTDHIIAQLMRHHSFQVTAAHYLDLGIADLTAAIDNSPEIRQSV